MECIYFMVAKLRCYIVCIAVGFPCWYLHLIELMHVMCDVYCRCIAINCCIHAWYRNFIVESMKLKMIQAITVNIIAIIVLTSSELMILVSCRHMQNITAIS